MADGHATGRNRELTGFALAIAGAIAFGTVTILAKKGYEAGADTVPLLAARFTITSIILFGYQALRRGPLWMGRRQVAQLLGLGAVGYAVEATLFFLALERAPASIVGLVFYSYPLWTTIIAVSIKLEPFTVRLVVALALGSAGVASIFSLSGSSLIGPLLALAAAVMVALFYIGAQVVSEGVPASAAAMWTATGAAVTLGSTALVQRAGLPEAAIPPALGLGITTAIAFIATYAAIARIGSSKTAIANTVELVTIIVLSTIFLSEDATLRVLIGAALVLSSIPVLATKKEIVPPAPETF